MNEQETQTYSVRRDGATMRGGNAGDGWYSAWLNLSDQDVHLKDAYPTVRNGAAGAIWCPRGFGLVRTQRGSAYDFATYVVVDVARFAETCERYDIEPARRKTYPSEETHS